MLLKCPRTSLVAQWLRFQTPNAGGPGSISDPGTRSHMPPLRPSTAKIRNLLKCPTYTKHSTNATIVRRRRRRRAGRGRNYDSSTWFLDSNKIFRNIYSILIPRKSGSNKHRKLNWSRNTDICPGLIFTYTLGALLIVTFKIKTLWGKNMLHKPR